MPKRKILLSVKDWSSEESIHTWKFLKAHLLQVPKEGAWSDELLVVHVSRGKEKDGKWDHGSAVIADLETSLQPWKHDVYDLEGDAGQLIVDIAQKEQADILVLASRGRNAMKKAMMGSMTDSVIQRVSCPCLVVKPQIGAGDTYRMKSAVQPQPPPLQQFGPAAASLQPVRTTSPCGSPMYGRLPGSMTTPFNRRVAVVYDTTASGRALLKWASEMVLEPADNVFVVRAVPKMQMRSSSTSFADKNSVQRLAGDALPNQPHVTAFNVQYSQQQGNRCRSVLSFVAKESVDLLIIGLYKAHSRRKGLALKGNALTLASRCACSCLVVPMSESALVASAEAADLEATAEEEEELVSGSEDDSGDDPITPTAINGAGSDEDMAGGGAAALDAAAGSPDAHGNNSFAMRGASAMKQIRAPLEALFKRRGSTTPGGFARERDDGGSLSAIGSMGGALPGGLDARRGLLLASLQGGGSGVGLPAGKYMVEVDASGAVKHIKVLVEKHHAAGGVMAPLAIPAGAEGDAIQMLTPAASAAVEEPPAAAAATAAVPATAGRGTKAMSAGGAPPSAAAAAGAAGSPAAGVSPGSSPEVLASTQLQQTIS